MTKTYPPVALLSLARSTALMWRTQIPNSLCIPSDRRDRRNMVVRVIRQILEDLEQGPLGNRSQKASRHRPIAALGAVALIVVFDSSDFYASPFWLGHPVTTTILASLSVVLVPVTLIDVILKLRSEGRWPLLARYMLLELAEAAHGAWGLLLGVIYEGNSGSDDLADPSRVIHVLDSPERAPVLKNKIDEILTDPLRRDELPESLEANPYRVAQTHQSMGSRLDRLIQFFQAFRSSRRDDRTYPRTVVLPGLWQTKGEPISVPRRQPPRRLVRRQPSIDDSHCDWPRR